MEAILDIINTILQFIKTKKNELFRLWKKLVSNIKHFFITIIWYRIWYGLGYNYNVRNRYTHRIRYQRINNMIHVTIRTKLGSNVFKNSYNSKIEVKDRLLDIRFQNRKLIRKEKEGEYSYEYYIFENDELEPFYVSLGLITDEHRAFPI